MPLDAGRLARRLARGQVQGEAQQAVILDLLSRLRPPLIGAFPSPYSPIEILRRARPTGTSVAFSSLANDRGIVCPEFTGVLQETRDTLVFVKDFKRLWFQNGIADPVPSRLACVIALRLVLSRMPRPWRFVGSSAGAFAALFFGAHLGADQIFAFAPQSRLDAPTVQRFTGQSPESGGVRIDDPADDLAQVLENHPLTGQAHVIYAADNRMDRRHAAALSGIDNLTLHTLPGKSHHVAYDLRKAGKLLDILDARAPETSRPIRAQGETQWHNMTSSSSVPAPAAMSAPFAARNWG